MSYYVLVPMTDKASVLSWFLANCPDRVAE